MERGGRRGEVVFLLFFSRSSQRRRADRVCRRLRTRAKRRCSRQKAKWNGIKRPMAKRGGREGKKRPSGRRKWKSGTEFAKRHRRVNGSYNESACDGGPKTRFGCLSFDWKVCRCFFLGKIGSLMGVRKRRQTRKTSQKRERARELPFVPPSFSATSVVSSAPLFFISTCLRLPSSSSFSSNPKKWREAERNWERPGGGT